VCFLHNTSKLINHSESFNSQPVIANNHINQSAVSNIDTGSELFINYRHFSFPRFYLNWLEQWELNPVGGLMDKK
jgi:hypothetical protein